MPISGLVISPVFCREAALQGLPSLTDENVDQARALIWALTGDAHRNSDFRREFVQQALDTAVEVGKRSLSTASYLIKNVKTACVDDSEMLALIDQKVGGIVQALTQEYPDNPNIPSFFR